MASETICISLVIPLYNESEGLPELLKEVRAVMDAQPETYELVLVDDGSGDGTWRSIVEAASADTRIRGIRFSRNFGKEAALAAGLEAAVGRAVILMDGDLQHPPALIPEMIARWREGDVAIVEAVKSDRGKESWWHRFGARVFYGMLSGIPGARLQGATDFKLLDRSAVEAWRTLGERNIFFRGMSAWLGFPRDEISFTVPERVRGASRWRLFQLIRLAVTGITAFSSLPLQITTFIGFCFLVFSVLLGGQTLYMKFSGEAVSGFATVILLLLILGSCILISLGVVGTYLARIYDEVKGRPRYLVTTRYGAKPVSDPESPEPP